MTNVRLTSVNGMWMAQAFAPCDEHDESTPSFDELPDTVATLIDDEWRLRDLCRYLAKSTKMSGETLPPDIPVQVDLTHRILDEDARTVGGEAFDPAHGTDELDDLPEGREDAQHEDEADRAERRLYQPQSYDPEPRQRCKRHGYPEWLESRANALPSIPRT